MTPDRWERAKELFEAALERSPEDRATFLAEACHGDMALCDEVKRLLGEHDRVGGFLQSTPGAAIAVRRLADAPDCFDAGGTAELPQIDSAVNVLRQRYDILAEVGRGGMGIIYRARDRETGDVVALKVLKPEVATRPELIEGFKRELLLARKVTHKNICRTFELLRFGDTTAIAMEYVEGESLRSLLARVEGLSTRQGLKIFRQVIAGVGEAHAQGVVHRDLKPENIVIDRQGNVKVMDFGIARTIETTTTTTGAIVGTPAYMSPEQAQGRPAEARSDIYSLGLILYEMFTGQPALSAESPVALALKQIHDTPPPPREVEPDVPTRIDRAIQKCLEKNPNNRFQSVAELEAALTPRQESKPAVAASEEVKLPFHLTHWQRSDWLLTCAAILGLGLFFPFFNRTSLAPRCKVQFDRSVLYRIAEEYAQRLGVSPGEPEGINGSGNDYQLSQVAKRAGLWTALELASGPVSYWNWNVSFDKCSLTVDARGSLLSFWRNFPVGVVEGRRPLEEDKPLAEKAIQDFLGADLHSSSWRPLPRPNWSVRHKTGSSGWTRGTILGSNNGSM